MDAAKFALLSAVLHNSDLGCLRQEGADHGHAVFHVPAEIVERIGMPPLDNGISFGRQLGHEALS